MKSVLYFHVKLSQILEEIKRLFEVSFECICEKDGLTFSENVNKLQNQKVV